MASVYFGVIFTLFRFLNWLFAAQFSNCSNSLNFEAKINFNTSRQNELKWRKTCTGLKFDLEYFNGPQTKFIGDSLYKHPVDIKYIGNFRGKRFGREHILRSHFSFIFCNKTEIRPIKIHELFISECFFANGWIYLDIKPEKWKDFNPIYLADIRPYFETKVLVFVSI